MSNLIKTNQSVTSFDDIFQSPSKVLKYQDRGDLLKFIVLHTLNFLNVNSPDPNNAPIAAQFAEDIADTRWDWKPEDIEYFFKFIRRRQDIPECNILGNKITALKLASIVPVYEDWRCRQKEDNIAQSKKESKKPLAPSAQKIVEEIVNRLKTPPIPIEHRKSVPIPEIKDETPEQKLFRETTNKSIENEKLMDEWILEFDALNKKQGNLGRTGGIRMVLYKDQELDINDYLKEKLNALQNH